MRYHIYALLVLDSTGTVRQHFKGAYAECGWESRNLPQGLVFYKIVQTYDLGVPS